MNVRVAAQYISPPACVPVANAQALFLPAAWRIAARMRG